MILYVKQYVLDTLLMLVKLRELGIMLIWELVFLVSFIWVVLCFVWDIFLNMLFIINLLWLLNSIWIALPLLILIGLLNLGPCSLVSRVNLLVTRLKRRYKRKAKVLWQRNLLMLKRRKKKFKLKKRYKNNHKRRKEWLEASILFKQENCPNQWRLKFLIEPKTFDVI